MPGDLPAHCARLLEAWAATVARRPDALALARRLDADLRAVPPAWSETDNLTVARLLEANGDTAGALAAVQRRRVDLTPLFHSAYLREEARLARSVRGN
ncbi:MAG TPA: hypothetical protein VEB59_01280 [Gemmatimonadales bacterium]|nr:hypothetical protein [Gemmatimonadales bacterium]